MKIAPSEYFARQAALNEVGPEGVARLQAARVTIVGVGGVGCAIAVYLAKAGVGTLRLIDQDIVEPTNLQRLHGISETQLYLPKAEAVREAIVGLHPWVKAEAVVETLRQANAEELLAETDIVFDGLDNFRTRYVLNRYCSTAELPYLFTSSVALQGHVGLFTPPETPCLECALPGVQDGPENACELLGASSSTVGVVGAIAAEEASKFLLGLRSRVQGSILTIDMMGPDFLLTRVTRRDNCPVCRGEVTKMPDEGVAVMLCGARTANVLPKRTLLVDLKAVAQYASETVLASSDSVLVYRLGSHIVSLFQTGRVIVDGVRDQSEALQIAEKVWKQAERASSPRLAGLTRGLDLLLLNSPPP
ncbi:HesA/MoeB/ThiF family protein [Candidatus Bathyarchaeota archaeon]|nr:MAG: HesA/MoeB/ThiF family protein [Candidatus Bathyarchaeota archaeon]